MRTLGVASLMAVLLVPAGAMGAPAPDGTVSHGSLSAGGLERHYRLFDPGGARGLVIALHPQGENGDDFAAHTRFDLQAARYRLLALYPDGLDRAWNAGYCCPAFHPRAVDDVALLRGLLGRFKRPGWPVFLTGFSNGGMLAYRAACEIEGITAVGVVGTDGERCSPPRPLPAVIHLQGTGDRLTGNRLWEEVGGAWVNTGITATTYWRGLGAEVELVEVRGGGHDWYRRSPDASAEIATFFAAHLA